MPTRPHRSLWLCAVLLPWVLAGCADELKVAPPAHAPRLTGDWRLNQAASGRVNAAVADLQSQLLKLMGHGHAPIAAPGSGTGRPAGGQAPRSPGGTSSASPTTGGSSPGQQAPAVVVSAPRVGANLVEEFLAHVPEGNALALRVAPGAFTQQTGAGAEQCTPGVLTAVTLGKVGADEICGWNGRAFVVRIKPEYGPTLTERYALASNGELVFTLRLAGGGLDARLVRRYRRTSRPPPSPLPTAD